ncbi:MAG TPA: TMEM165/GDT1 family protein [Coleofasciculaceae cyanobacterium]
MKLSPPPLASLVLTAVPTLLKPTSKHSDDASESSTLSEFASSSPVSPTYKPHSVQERKRGFWGVFSSTFITIFLAEMGDKTQLATLLMSAQSQSPWTVFAGAAVALISTSLLGVLIGHWLSQKLSPKTIETAAAILLLFISATLFWDVMTF